MVLVAAVGTKEVLLNSEALELFAGRPARPWRIPWPLSSLHYDIDTSVKTIQHAIHCLFSARGLPDGGRYLRLVVADNFDKMAAVVDWLDACRSKNLDALLDFYADSASLECACEGMSISGRSALAAYWRPKLSGGSRKAFTLEEITPRGEGVDLDCLNYEGKPVRIVFGFDTRGRISRTACEPR